jgi:hypothetical protein
MIPLAQIIAAIQAGLALAEAGSKALNAANNGDDAKARQYLRDARTHFDSARSDWDAAPGPSD